MQRPPSASLINLGNNALKFTEPGGEVVIAVSLLEEDKTSALLSFSVKDTGIGMSAEEQAKLFQSFSQAGSSTTRKFDGTGLGLVIAKRLSELIGGKIGVESKPGIGSNLDFTARVGKQGGDPWQRSPVVEELSPLRVLVVDDNDTSRDILGHMLDNFGVKVATAELLEREVFDGVLMDCQMPVMDGYTILASFFA